MTTRMERYLAHLATLSGGVEWRIHEIEPGGTPDLGTVVSISFPGVPEGLTTSFTYGLSVADRPEWVRGRPELVISTAGDDLSWGIAVAMIVERMRGVGPFSYGDVLDLGAPMVESSEMTALLINRPLVLGPAQALNIDVGDALPIHIAGAIPLHASEAQHIREHGVESLNDYEWDPYDVTRGPVV